MNGRALFHRPSTQAARAASGEAFNALDSRPGPHRGRESRGARALGLFALVLIVFLMCSPVAARGGVAKAKTATEVLAELYSLDESPEESDGALIRRRLLKLLSRADVRLFLAVIKQAEGGEPNIMVGGCRAATLKLHPALTLPRRCRFYVPGWGFSTASGNYQITYSNWKEIAPFLRLEDFSETSQALAALELIRRGGGAANAGTPGGLALKRRIQGGFVKLLQGNLKSALCLASYDWASSTCSPLPASYKNDYAKLVEGVRKSLAAERIGKSVPRGPRTVDVRDSAPGPKVETKRPRQAPPCDSRSPVRRQGK